MQSITLFEYQHKQVRTILVNGEVWFVAADVCNVLGIANASDAVSRLNPAWTMVSEIPTPSRGIQKMVVITEGAVYKLAFRSSKPEAERFTDWIAGEVIPQIRKTGRYIPKHQGILPLAAHTSVEVQTTLRIARLTPATIRLGLNIMAERLKNSLPSNALLPKKCCAQSSRKPPAA